MFLLVNRIEALLCFRVLVDGVPHRRLRLKPGCFYTKFVVDILTLVYVFLGLLLVSSLDIIPPMLCPRISFTHYRRYIIPVMDSMVNP